MKRDDDGTDLENVMTYWDVARGKEVPGDHVVVYDRMGDWAAASIVELLVNQGKQVHIVTSQRSVGSAIQSVTLALWNQRIDGKPITRTTDASVVAISDHAVTLATVHGTDRRWEVDGVNTVVLCCGGTPNDGLYEALKGKVRDLRMVGDCEAPLPIERSIYSAELLGRAI